MRPLDVLWEAMHKIGCHEPVQEASSTGLVQHYNFTNKKASEAKGNGSYYKYFAALPLRKLRVFLMLFLSIVNAEYCERTMID